MQRALIPSLTLLALAVSGTAHAAAVRDLPGFRATAFAPCDDGGGELCTPDPSQPQAIGFAVDFFGLQASTVFVNNNGNVTFDTPLTAFVPQPLVTSAAGYRMIAPFWADVDTRGEGSGVVTYGNDTVDGRTAFGVNWVGVGYYAQRVAPLNSFQLVLVERADTGAGNFDIEFNYDRIQWEAGDESGDGGLADAADQAARVGFANQTVAFELPGSGVARALLDANPAGLVGGSLGSAQPGRYVFPVRNGRLAQCTDNAFCDDGDPCTADTCVRQPNEAIGTCSSTPANEGAACSDDDLCTDGDTCTGGACAGRAKVCDDGDPCTADTCDPEVGVCANPVLGDGTSCDDEDGCSDASACSAGACVAVSRSCTLSSVPPPEGSTTKPQVKVTCADAAAGSRCVAELFEAVETESAVPQALQPPRLVPDDPTAGDLVVRSVLGFAPGQAFAKTRRKKVNRRGRAVLVLKLNKTAKRTVKTEGSVAAILDTRVEEPSGAARRFPSLIFLRQRGGG